MKYGICTSAEVAARAKECGYDYIESALQVVASLSDEDFNNYVETMKSANMKCLAMCGFFPGTIKLVGDEADFEKIKSLGADFDENGMATGEFRPKPSYRTLQVLASVFREDFSVEELPVRLLSKFYSPRLFRNDDMLTDVITYGVRKPNGSSAFVYWKPAELLTTSYSSTISIEAADIKGGIRLVDLVDGKIYMIPENLIERNNNGAVILKNLPLLDYPLMITFGDFL